MSSAVVLVTIVCTAIVSALPQQSCKYSYYQQSLLRSQFYTFDQERDENGEWRRLHNEELYSLYRTPNVVRVIRSRKLKRTSHVDRMKKVRVLSKF